MSKLRWLALGTHFVTSSLLYAQFTSANVEKTIFVASDPEPVPAGSPLVDDLGLERLSPEEFKLRTNLNASFPTQQRPHGTESWFYLEDLIPGQRYEVRVCWLATVGFLLPSLQGVSWLNSSQQPTAFILDTYSLSEALSSQELVSSLAAFSESHLASMPAKPPVKASKEKDYLYPPKPPRQRNSPYRNGRSSIGALTAISGLESVLFLRILAAADYFTANATLMESVQPVRADIILDPFFLNVFPRSLVPTVIYGVPVAVIVYIVGAYVANALSAVVATAVDPQVRVDHSTAVNKKDL